MTTINTPTGGNDGGKLGLHELTGERKEELSKTLYGDLDAVLADLMKNHIHSEYRAEMLGHVGKKIYLDLPAIGDFKGYKFECFTSDLCLSKKKFESNPDFEKLSYSSYEVDNFYEAMSKYLDELGISGDLLDEEEYDYDRPAYDTSGHGIIEAAGCYDFVGDFLGAIMGLRGPYRLKDRDIGGTKGSRYIWYSKENLCEDTRYGDEGWYAQLLLKLS